MRPKHGSYGVLSQPGELRITVSAFMKTITSILGDLNLHQKEHNIYLL